MISELIVTSAPRGLQAGRSGFTTVCRTRGIHPDLASRLEAASGYRHVFPQGDPRNPVVFSYTSKPSSLGEVWVMSRVGDAGTDYTGRSNKIAHHIALQQSDLPPLAHSNPAAVMAALAASGGLLAKWQGDPRENTAPPQLSAPPTNPSPCQRWASVTGDPGWAGILAERALNKEATWIIAPAGTDLLALFSEALALISPNQRWQVPFTTYSLRGDEGRWLGTVAGSPEAEAAAAQKRIQVIDLTRRSMAPSGGLYVAAARGQANAPWHREKTVALVRSDTPTQRHPAAQTGSVPDGVRAQPGLPPLLTRPLASSSAQPPGLTEWEDIELAKPRTSRLMLFVTLSLVVLVFGSLLVGYGAYRLDWLPADWVPWQAVPKQETAAHTAKPDLGKESRETASPSKGDSATALAKKGSHPAEEPRKKPPTVADKKPSDSVENSLAADAKTQGNGNADKPNAQSAGTSPQRPATQPKRRRPVIELLVESLRTHLPTEGLNTAKNAGSTKFTLVKWDEEADPKSLADITLELPKIDESLEGNCELTPLVGGDTKPQVRQWKCHVAKKREEVVGIFTLTPGMLDFDLEQGANTRLENSLLPFFPLVIAAGEDHGGKRSSWLQLVSPKDEAAFVTGKQERLLYANSIKSTEKLLSTVFEGSPTRLRWKNLMLQADGDDDSLQLSRAGEWDFRDGVQFPKTVALPARLWWQPSRFAKPPDPLVVFQETVELHVDIRSDKAGVHISGRSNFLCDAAVGNAAAADKSSQIRNLLLKARETPPLKAPPPQKPPRGMGMINGSQWRKIIENVTGNGLAFSKRDGTAFSPKEKKDLLDSAYPKDTKNEKEERSLADWLADLQDICAKDEGFLKYAETIAAEHLKNDPFRTMAEPPAAPEANATTTEGERQKAKTLRDNWDKAEKQYAKNLKHTIDKLSKDAATLLAWAHERLEKEGEPSAANVVLSLWRVLYKYQAALDYGFVSTPKLQNGNNEPSLEDLGALASKSQIVISGILELEWDGAFPGREEEDPDPPRVRIATLRPRPPAGAAAGVNEAPVTEDNGPGMAQKQQDASATPRGTNGGR